MRHTSKVANGICSIPVYHLLRPRDGANQLKQLEVGEEMAVKDQGIWIPTRIIG